MVLFAAGILFGGFLYFRNYEKDYFNEVGRHLTAIGSLKIDELERYRKERLGSADFFFRNKTFTATVQRYFEKPGTPGAKDELYSLLDKFRTDLQYDSIFLLDIKGSNRISAPEATVPHAAAVSLRVPEIFRSGKVTFMDFYRNEHDGKVYLAVLVPIFGAHDRPLGVLVLRIDPDTYLTPYIKRWPTDSKTSETLIVRRKGNDVLFLNELKYWSNTALNLHFPLDRVELPAVKAILGQKGIVEGRDYNGVPVIAYVSPVSGSPWFLVARTNTSEVYAPLRERLWTTVSFVFVLLLSACAMVSLIWRQQRFIFFKERLHATEMLLVSEERYKSLFNQAPLGIALIDSLAGQIYAVNPMFAKIAGRTTEEMHHLSLINITHPDDVQEVINNMAMLNAGEIPGFCMEKRFIHKDGSAIWINMTTAPVSVEDIRYPRHLCMIEDITNRKNNEKELQDKNAELERFNYTLSHELRSPLVTVKSFLGFLEKDLAAADAERIAKDIDFMRTATDKMNRLLDDLLEMSRIGRVVNEPVSVKFGELVQEVLTLAAERITEQGVTVQVDDADMMLIGDRPRLAEVWLNLIENAVKYMGDQPAPHIRIGVVSGKGSPVFYICDNGIGIDPRYHEKVFTIFDKLDAKSEGTGLGLALVKRIVELYGGRIWVESAGVGHGSCFRFTVPGAVK